MNNTIDRAVQKYNYLVYCVENNLFACEETKLDSDRTTAQRTVGSCCDTNQTPCTSHQELICTLNHRRSLFVLFVLLHILGRTFNGANAKTGGREFYAFALPNVPEPIQ